MKIINETKFNYNNRKTYINIKYDIQIECNIKKLNKSVRQ